MKFCAKHFLILLSVALLLYTSSIVAYSAAMPLIANFNKTSCYKSGEKIIIYGKGFGTRSGKGLAIGGNGIHVDIKTVTQWTDKKITAVLPTDPRIQPKQYYIGIELANHSNWLSNISKSLSFCDPPTSSQSAEIHSRSKSVNPSLSTSSHQIDPVNKTNRSGSKIYNSSHGQSDPNDDYYEDDYYEPLDNKTNRERSYGSLISKGLPPPPQLQIKKSVNKSDDHREPQEAMIASADMKTAIELANYLSNYGITVKRRKLYANLGIVISILRIPEGTDVPDTINLIRQEIPELWADENQRYTLLESSDRKTYGHQQIGWTDKHQSCGNNVKVGLIDTGVANHSSLSSQSVVHKSFLSAGVETAPMDHGTGIASLLVASTSSDEFTGLLPNATLYSAAIFRLRDKKQVDTTAELVVAALDWLVGEGVKVINLSFGGPRNLILELVLSGLVEHGLTIVSAAGTNGKYGPPLFPAAQPGVFAVTAIDANFRPFPNAPKGDYIDFAGPGVDVWVASPNGAGKFSSGSSFATPFVTAAAAIIPQDNEEIYQLLKEQAKDLGNPGKDPQFGWGLVKVSNKCG